MVRLRRPPEWGVEPVPPALRVLRTFDLFVLWSSLGVGLLVLAAGALLIRVGGFGFGLTLAESAVVAFVGSGLGCVILAPAAHHGGREGVSSVIAATWSTSICLIVTCPDTGARHAPFSGVASLLLALDLVIAMPVSWWPLISDYNRFARSSKDSITGTAAGYTIANTLFYMLGAGLMALGIALGQPNFLAVIGLLGLGVFPLFIILVDETDNAFGNIYSTAVPIQNLP